MGLKSPGPIGFDTLGIGITVAFFQCSGKTFVSIDALKILRRKKGLC